jgi:hypothetical protein
MCYRRILRNHYIGYHTSFTDTSKTSTFRAKALRLEVSTNPLTLLYDIKLDRKKEY